MEAGRLHDDDGDVSFNTLTRAQFRNCFESLSSSDGYIDESDLRMLLRHFGPDTPSSDVRKMMMEFGGMRKPYHMCFDEFLSLLARYQRNAFAMRQELENSFVYFLKKIAVTKNDVPIHLSKDQFSTILQCGENRLSNAEIEAINADLFTESELVNLSARRFVAECAYDDLLWGSTSFSQWNPIKPYSQIKLEKPPSFTFTFRIVHAQLYPQQYARWHASPVHVRSAALGIACESLDLCFRFRINQEIFSQSQIRYNVTFGSPTGNTQTEWDEEIQMHVNLRSLNISKLQEWTQCHPLYIDLLHHHPTHNQWLATGQIALISLLSHASVQRKFYTIQLFVNENRRRLGELRISIGVQGPPLTSIFSQPEHRWLIPQSLHPIGVVDPVEMKIRSNIEERSLLEIQFVPWCLTFPCRSTVIKLLAFDEELKCHLINKFIAPSIHSESIKVEASNENDRSVSNLMEADDELWNNEIETFRRVLTCLKTSPLTCPMYESNHLIQSRQISSPHTIISRGYTSSDIERAVLVASMCAIATSHRWFVAIGSNGSTYESDPRVWLILKTNLRGILHFDSIDLASLTKTQLESYRIVSLIDSSCIWLNCQSTDSINRVNWNLKDLPSWRCITVNETSSSSSSVNYDYRALLERIQAYTRLIKSADRNVDFSITASLCNTIRNYRKRKFKQKTLYHIQSCKKWMELMRSSVGAKGGWSEQDSPIIRHHDILKALPPHYILYARHFEFEFDSLGEINEQLIWSGILDCTLPGVYYGISAYQISHPIVPDAILTKVVVGFMYDVNTRLMEMPNEFYVESRIVK